MFITKIRASSAEDRSPWGDFFFQPIGALSSSGVHVTPTSALGLGEVFSCVRVLAESFAVLPFKLYRPRAGGKGRERITKHWLYRLFAKAPNQFQSPYEFREMLQGHVALRGNAFCQITANSKGEITELLPLHPDRMKIEVLPNGNYRYRYTDQNGRDIYYTRGEIWHLRGLSSDGLVGLSPIDVARESIGEGLAMQRYASRFFANDAKPGGGWIEYPGKFATTEAKRKFRESWQEMQGGANRYKVAVLEQGMKFHELGVAPKDAQFVEARASKPAAIARIFRVPPHKIGDLTKATFSNIEQQSIEFWQDTMLPWTERWEASIEFALLGPDTDLEVEFDMRRMMRADSAARSSYYNTGVQGGWLTRNEVREEEGLDPIDGLDEPMQPLNMARVGADEPPAGDDDDDAQDATAARLDRVLRSNAARLARRAARADGPSLTAPLLSEALGISEQRAQAWLDTHAYTAFNEQTLAAALLQLGATA